MTLRIYKKMGRQGQNSTKFSEIKSFIASISSTVFILTGNLSESDANNIKFSYYIIILWYGY